MNKSFSKKFSRSFKVLTSVLLLSQGASALADTLPVLDLGRNINLGRDIDLGRVRLPLPDLRCAIDPAATQVGFRVLSRTSTYRGRVQIVGTIKNLGRQSFLSRYGQQAVYLYEDSRVVARRSFTSLAPGASLSLAYQRNWDASSPAEGEFPPTYKVVISYGPDIYIDGNPNNDDCRSQNNQLSKSGTAINQLF